MPSQEKVNEQYLVIQTGHEGIERIYGIFNKQEAIDVISEKKASALAAKKVSEEYHVLDQQLIAEFKDDYEKYSERMDKFFEEHPGLFKCDNPDFYCVVTVDRDGTQCVCEELGVKPSKPMLR